MFFLLTASLALQNLLTYSVNMMDTLMLGRYAQNAMGGVSLCNQIQYLLQSELLFVLEEFYPPLCSYWFFWFQNSC